MDHERPNVDHLLNWVDPEPHPFLLDLQDYETQRRLSALSKFKATIMVAEGALAAMAESASDHTWAQSSAQPFRMATQVLFLSQAVAPLYCAFKLGLQGFIDESIPLVRVATEGALRVIFIQLHPKSWESAFASNREIESVGGSTVNRRDFIATNIFEQHLKVPGLAKVLYGLPSQFVHSKKLTANGALKAMVQKRDFSSLSPYPKPPPGVTMDDWFGIHLNLIQIALYLQLLVHEALLSQHQTDPTRKRITDAVDGMSRWLSEPGSIHAALVPDLRTAVARVFAPPQPEGPPGRLGRAGRRNLRKRTRNAVERAGSPD